MLNEKYLKEFITNILIENERVTGYHLRQSIRKPRVDVSNEINNQRREIFNDVANQFRRHIQSVKNSVHTSNNMHDFEARLDKFNLSLEDIFMDFDKFEIARKNNDLSSIKILFNQEIDKWSEELVKDLAEDGYEYGILTSYIS